MAFKTNDEIELIRESEPDWFGKALAELSKHIREGQTAINWIK